LKEAKLAYFYGISAILLWSTAAVAFKIALKNMDFIQLLFYSSMTSTILLLAFIGFRGELGKLLRFSKKQYFYSIFLGLLNPVAYYLVLLKAYSILPAQLAQPLNYTWPVVLVLLSAPLLKQKLKLRSILAILISFLGVYIISSRDAFFELQIEQPFGIFLAASSSIIWALYWIFSVKDNRPELLKLGAGFLFSLPITGVAVYFFSDFKLPETNGLLAAMYVGFFEMGFTFILWMKALQMLKRNDKLSNLVYISPFFALTWIHFILGEDIYKTTIIGLVFIILGIFVQQFQRQKTKVES
jgi:drug/metabolite transporter (DMT)-like permease